MTTISNNDIARAIYLSSKDKNDGDLSLFYKKVVQFLVKKRLLSKAKDILVRLDKIINNEEGRIVARVSSRENLSEKTKNELIHSLSKRYFAKDVILVPNLDEKLLGGLKIKVNDEIIDLTIKNRIRKLQEYLTRDHE